MACILILDGMTLRLVGGGASAGRGPRAPLGDIPRVRAKEAPGASAALVPDGTTGAGAPVGDVREASEHLARLLITMGASDAIARGDGARAASRAAIAADPARRRSGQDEPPRPRPAPSLVGAICVPGPPPAAPGPRSIVRHPEDVT